jgi:hypothetical protein
MTISRRETGPNLRDAQIAVAKAMGLTHEETGKVICTPKHPDGISPETVKDRISANSEFIGPFIQWCANLVQNVKNRALDELTEKDVRKLIKSKSWKRLDKLIDSENESIALAASKEGLDRTEGKSVQTNLNMVAGQVNHIVTHQLPEAFYSSLPTFAQQHGLAPVIDVKVLDSGEDS